MIGFERFSTVCHGVLQGSRCRCPLSTSGSAAFVWGHFTSVVCSVCGEWSGPFCASLLGSAWARDLEVECVMISPGAPLSVLWLHIQSPLPAGESSLYLIFIGHPRLVGTMQIDAVLEETRLEHQVLRPAGSPHAPKTEWLEALRAPGCLVVPRCSQGGHECGM